MVPICTLFHSLLHRCITASYKCKLAGINLNPCGNPLILWEYLFILSCCSRPPKVWKRMLIIVGNYRMVTYRCECCCCPGAQSEEYWYCYLQATGHTLVCFGLTLQCHSPGLLGLLSACCRNLLCELELGAGHVVLLWTVEMWGDGKGLDNRQAENRCPQTISSSVMVCY